MKLYSLPLRCLQRVLPVETQRGLLNTSTLEYLKPEVVLSEQSRKSFIEKFKARNFTKDLEKKINRAAVLVPLCKHEGELGFLYTLRSTKLTSNRGQVSFPGGMYDDSDRNLEETAIRETWEELNIPRKKIDVWTSGNMINKKDLHVLPVFGYIGEVDPKNLQINTNEVEEAFFLSLKNLCDPSQYRHTQFRNNYTMPTYLGGKHRVWGFTAVVTHLVLNVLIPDAYQHKLVFIPPVLPKSKDKIKVKFQTNIDIDPRTITVESIPNNICGKELSEGTLSQQLRYIVCTRFYIDSGSVSEIREVERVRGAIYDEMIKLHIGSNSKK